MDEETALPLLPMLLQRNYFKTKEGFDEGKCTLSEAFAFSNSTGYESG